MNNNVSTQETTTTKRPVVTVGLDMHPDTFTAAILVGSSAQEAEILKIGDRLPVEQLERWFKGNTDEDCLVAIEASGNTFTIVDRLEAIGRKVIVLDSAKVGKVSKTYCITDKTSAIKIAKICISGLSDEIYVPDTKTRERRNIYTAYQQSQTDAQRAVNRAKGFLNERTIRVKRKAITNAKEREHLLSRLDLSDTEVSILKQHFAIYDLANANMKKWRIVMAEDILSDPELLKMVRIYGLRHITVFALAAYIGNIARFSNPKKLVAYIGLNPRVQMSGEGGFIGSLAGNGRKELRALLIEAAHCVFFHKNKSNPNYSWAWKLHFRKGRKIAAIATARKIVTALWYLLNGKFTELKEASKNLRTKISRLVAECSEEFRAKQDCKWQKDIVQKKIDLLMTIT